MNSKHGKSVIDMTLDEFNQWYEEVTERNRRKQQHWLDAEAEAEADCDIQAETSKLFPIGASITDYLQLFWRLSKLWWIFVPIMAVVVIVFFWAVNSFSYYFFPQSSEKQMSTPSVSIIREVPTIRSNKTFKDLHSWMEASQANELRTKENVRNFAYLLKGGRSLYSSHQTLQFPNSRWTRDYKPLPIEEIQLKQTFVTLVIEGSRYDLNIYQPFTIEGYETQYWVVDEEGYFWKTGDDQGSFIEIISLPEPKKKLPPNSNLSLSPLN